MAGKVLLGLLFRQNNLSQVCRTNLWGHFSRCSYKTAQKTEKALHDLAVWTEEECRIHNSKIPTYEQFENSTELQAELTKMYQHYATDPDFQQITTECMEIAKRNLSREKPKT